MRMHYNIATIQPPRYNAITVLSVFLSMVSFITLFSDYVSASTAQLSSACNFDVCNRCNETVGLNSECDTSIGMCIDRIDDYQISLLSSFAAFPNDIFAIIQIRDRYNTPVQSLPMYALHFDR